MSEVLISPSLLSADFSDIRNEIQKLTAAGADWLHVDVMDGNFVPNLTFGMPIVKSFKPHSKLPLDVHLMIEKPERYIAEFVAAGADYLTLHLESTEVLEASLVQIRALGCKAGITIKPLTAIEKKLSVRSTLGHWTMKSSILDGLESCEKTLGDSSSENIIFTSVLSSYVYSA